MGDIRTGDAPTVAKDEVVDSALYTAGGNIRIEGTVRGDVFCAGEAVEIAGTVEGDVLCAAQSIAIRGEVHGDVRSAAQTITLIGRVDGSITLAARMASVENTARVGGDVTLLTQEARIEGQAGRDISSYADKVVLGGQVDRDVYAEAQNIEITNQAHVNGNFVYKSEQSASIANEASIVGSTEHRVPEPDASSNMAAVYLGGALFGLGSLLLVGLGLFVAAPRLLDATAMHIRKYHVWPLGLGLFVLIGAPLVAVALMVTLIGIPLGILMLLAWGAALISSSVFTSYAVGQIVTQKLHIKSGLQRVAALGLGLLILFLLALIPYAGGFVILLAVVWGLGGLCLTIARTLRVRQLNVKSKKEERTVY